MMEPMTGSDAPEKPAPLAEFEGFAECPLFAEKAKITIDKDGLLVATLFDQLPIPYGEIAAISLADSRVEVQTAAGSVAFSRMGQEAEWLYQKLYAAYNDAVLGALLVEGEPGFEATGEYSAEENSVTRQGQAVIRLYEDCLCILPPDENARRIPLCFLTGMEKLEFSLALTLSTGERYTLRGLGRELDNLERLLTKNLRALREATLVFHKELAPDLGSMQAAAAAKLMPLGTAASMEKLSAAAPPLAAALEEKIKESRMAQTYPWLHDLCGGAGLTVGAKPAPEKKDQPEAAMPGLPPQQALPQGANPMMGLSPPGQEEPTEAAEKEPAPILWIVASDREKRIAAVELALADNEAAATYLYRVEGKWETFARVIDRALEAAGFQREPILLPDKKLHTPEHLADAMLVKRTPALGLLRSQFAGRAIHSSPHRWRADIEKCRGLVPQASTKTATFCTNCGVKLAPDAKFCGQCGFQF